MKYKVGDKVRVRSLGALKRGKGEGWRDEYKLTFLEGMESACGKSFIIEGVTIDGNFIINGGCFIFSDDIFEGYAFEYGDEIEFGDDGVNWVPRIYLNYTDGLKYPYKCVVDSNEKEFTDGYNFSVIYWKYARPIQTQKIELTLKVNGEEKPLDYLSEESLLRIRVGKL